MSLVLQYVCMLPYVLHLMPIGWTDWFIMVLPLDSSPPPLEKSAICSGHLAQWLPQPNYKQTQILAISCCTCRKVAYCYCFAVACNNTSQSKVRVLLITFQHNNFTSSNNSSCNRLYTNVGFIIPYRTKLFIGINVREIRDCQKSRKV